MSAQSGAEQFSILSGDDENVFKMAALDQEWKHDYLQQSGTRHSISKHKQTLLTILAEVQLCQVNEISNVRGYPVDFIVAQT